MGNKKGRHEKAERAKQHTEHLREKKLAKKENKKKYQAPRKKK